MSRARSGRHSDDHWVSADAGLAGDPFRLTALADLADVTLRPEDRLWWDAVLRGHVTILCGETNIGKTTLLRNIVRAVSRGELFLGWAGPSGGAGVVVLDYETPGIDRWSKWRLIYGDEISAIHNVVISRETPLLDKVVSAEAVIAMLRRHGARLLVVDTLARAFAVDSENCNAEMSAVMTTLKHIADAGFAVVVVAHFGKASGTGIQALRGASAIAASADIVVGLYRAEGKTRAERKQNVAAADVEVDDEPSYLLDIFKNRTAGQGTIRLFRDGEGGFRSSQGADSADTRARSIRLMDGIVAEAGAMGISTAEAVGLAADQGLSRRAAIGALQSLADDGTVEQPRRGRYIHCRARGGERS